MWNLFQEISVPLQSHFGTCVQLTGLNGTVEPINCQNLFKFLDVWGACARQGLHGGWWAGVSTPPFPRCQVSSHPIFSSWENVISGRGWESAAIGGNLKCYKTLLLMWCSSVSHFGTSCSLWLEPVGFLSILPFWTILPFGPGLKTVQKRCCLFFLAHNVKYKGI